MTSGTAEQTRRMRPAGHSFRPDIQGLRAVAVIAVLLDHLFGWPTGGFVGVDIFFVISGFLITGLLLREYQRTGTISFRRFYERRVKRILPASVLVLFVTVVTASLVLPATRAKSTVVDAIWSFFFAGNWRFAATGTDYFQEGTLLSPLQHFWSLGVEEQFYLVWPWLMLAILVTMARARTGPAESRRVIAAAMVVIILVSGAWALHQSSTDETWAYFSTFTRAWELGIGALLAVAAPLLGRIPAGVRPLLAWTGSAGMLASILWVSAENGGFPAPWAAFPVFSVALVIAAGTGAEVRGLWPLTNPVSRYIGDISFSLYLWHWPVIVLLVAVVPSEGPLYVLLALVLSFGLSSAGYHLVENPLRRVRWFGWRREHATGRPKPSPQRISVAVALMVVAALGISVSLVSIRGGVTDPADAVGEEGDQRKVSALMDRCLGAASLETGADCDGVLGDGLWPSVDSFATEVGGSFQCWRERDGKAFPECDLGAAEGEYRVALRGDSHAASLLPAIEPIAESQGWELDVFTGWGCHWYVHDEGDNCQGPLEQAQAAMLTGEPYDAVIVSSSRYDTVRPVGERRERYEQAWAPVAERGTKIIVVADAPASTDAALECLTRVGFNPQDQRCGTSAEEAFALVDPLPEVASRIEGAEVIDLREYFCRDGFCPAVIGNAVVYRDSKAHLTATYMRSLEPMLRERLVPAVQQ